MQLKHIAAFTSDIDFANLPWKPETAEAKGADIYVMSTESQAFGWLRSFEKENVSGTPVKIRQLKDGPHKITWINTWTGKTVKTEKVTSKNGELGLTVPKLTEEKPDIAFKIIKN